MGGIPDCRFQIADLPVVRLQIFKSEICSLTSSIRFLTSVLALQLPPQRLHHLPDDLLIPPIAAPQALLGRLHQPGLGQDCHMV